MEDQENTTPREVTNDPPEAAPEAVIEQTEEPEAKLMTWADIQDFFIKEGEWLEEQIEAEKTSPYKMCPACSTAANALQLLYDGLKDADEQSRAMLEANLKEESAIWFFSRECKWYEVSKSIVLGMMQAAHTPHLIARVHPDLAHASRMSSFSRKNKTTKEKRKLERQRKTQARRKAT